MEKADEIKLEANKLFANGDYPKALDKYTLALSFAETAVLYSNRSFSNLKLENYAAALQDAAKAIELDSNYVKGYYRHGSANLALNKPKLALQDFRTVVKLEPGSREARTKLKECDLIVKKIAFEQAIAGSYADPTGSMNGSSVIPTNPDLIEVESDYDGPRFGDSINNNETQKNENQQDESNNNNNDDDESNNDIVNMDQDQYFNLNVGFEVEDTGINLKFVLDMIERFKNQKLIHIRYAYRILYGVRNILKQTPTVVDLHIQKDKHFTVCGDIHGQFYDLCNIFSLNGLPSEDNPYLFNGDFVDRGSFSVEVILTLFAFKLLYPYSVHLSRGNHESRSMNRMYGFDGEVQSKFDKNLYELFAQIFCWLPLAHILDQKILIVHGGLLSDQNQTVEDLRKIDRNREPPDSGAMADLLWSDPQPFEGRSPSKRGIGCAFGPDITKKFLEENNLDLIVRSHEVKEEGYLVEADNKLITVFSAPNYCDQVGNKGAFIKFKNDLQPNFTSFQAVEHPAVRPMHYANSMWNNFL